MASTPPHCSITATTKRYQNHSYPHNQLKDHRQTHNQNPHQRWTSNQRVSLAKPPLPASSRNAPKPAATTTTTTTQHPQIHPTFPSFQPPKSELVSDFPGRRSTRFVSKLHFGRPRTTMGTRHTSVAQEALQNVIECGKDERALENVLLNFESRLSGSDDYVFLLRELGNRGDCKKAICCFEFAVKRERKKNEQGKLASAMISTLGRLGKVEMAKTVFEAALIEGYGNTVYAFSAIISAYGRSGYCNEAIKIFYSMKDYGLKPNLVTYNAVIDASGKGGVEFKRVLEIFDEMLRNGMQPDRITFNSLLAVCSKGGLWEAARSLSCEMVNRGIDQDIFTYNTLLDAVCKGGQLDMAFEIMSEMPAKNILPNVVTYSTMIDGYAKAGRLDDARNLFNEMKFLGISLDRVSYNTLLSIYAKLGRFEEAMDVCREMENSGIRKDVVTYNALLGGYGKQYKYDVVRKVFEEMKARHVSPNLLTYSEQQLEVPLDDDANMKRKGESGSNSWTDLLENPNQWWDYRSSKRSGLVKPKHPDFKHKNNNQSVWLTGAPSWIFSGLEKVKFDVKTALPTQTKQQKEEECWKDLVENPHKWWDNRVDKKNPKSPDFKHKETGEGLWLDTSPAWVLPKLPPTKGAEMVAGTEGYNALLSQGRT